MQEMTVNLPHVSDALKSRVEQSWEDELERRRRLEEANLGRGDMHYAELIHQREWLCKNTVPTSWDEYLEVAELVVASGGAIKAVTWDVLHNCVTLLDPNTYVPAWYDSMSLMVLGLAPERLGYNAGHSTVVATTGQMLPWETFRVPIREMEPGEGVHAHNESKMGWV